MLGLAINNTKDSFNLSFDKKIFDENMLLNWLKIIEIEYLAQIVDFDEDMLKISKEIKSSIWKSEKQNYPF